MEAVAVEYRYSFSIVLNAAYLNYLRSAHACIKNLRSMSIFNLPVLQ